MASQTRLTPNERLKRERVLRGWTQNDVAGYIGTDGYTVNRWERGRATPSPYFRQKLCELFGKNVEELGLLDEQHARYESRIPALWNIPYRRNPFFVGREKLFSRLHRALTRGEKVALTQKPDAPRIEQAICGLGGMGKTQAAVEYAYRYCGTYETVLWVQADSRSIVLSEFVRLAGVLNLSEQTEQDTFRVVEAVKSWLQQHTDWLLIFDNVEDAAVVSDVLPSLNRGHVLLTTRIQSTGSVAQPIEIERLSPEEGTLFLLRRTRMIPPDASLATATLADRQAATELHFLLEGLPLALDQAAAYIEETGCGIAGYLNRYHICRKELLAMRGATRGTDHPESVTTTLSLSFKNILQTNKAALELLSLCAFLHPEAIPEEIFLEGASALGPEFQGSAAHLLGLDSIISDLRKFSLVHRTPDANTLTLHRLVQAVIRDGMDEATQKVWAERAIRAVNQAFPDVTFATWAQCKRMLPHVLECSTHAQQLSIQLLEAARLFDQAGTYLREHAQYELAASLYQQSLAIWERAAKTSPDTIAHGLHNLALLYNEQDKYDEAEPLFLRAIELGKQSFGEKHEKVAEYVIGLAIVYDNQGKFHASEPLYLQALEILQNAVGEMHPDTATCLNNLGWLYMAQGKYAHAEPIYQQSLAIRRHHLAPNHPDIATSLNLLGWLYFARGKYSQGEAFLLEALTIRKEHFGAHHPDVAGTLNHLADVYRAKKCYDQSELYNRHALTIREQALGANHRDVATSLTSLGRLYLVQENYALAEACFQRSLSIREQALGKQHTSVAISLNDLAELCFTRHEYDQVAQFNQRAQEILAQTVGLFHPHTASSLYMQAELYRVQGRYDEAEPLYRQVITVRDQCLGAEHPDVAACVKQYELLLAIRDNNSPVM